jgi:D-alanyl-D-alanine carboxypeptidase
MTPRRFWTTLFTFALLLPCFAFADDALSRSLARQLELNRQRYGIAGQALLVAHDGRVLFRGVDGEADVDTHERMTTDHVFSAYSVSKLFLSTLVMQLVEQGRVDLDTPASTYLRDLPAPWRTIAVRDLLDHTSGLPEYFETQQLEGRAPTFPADLPALYASLAGKPMQFAPGTNTRYTQTNYVVLAALLAAHYGKPYPQVVDERIVRKLGLKRTWLGQAAQPQPGVVTSYMGKNGRLQKDQDVAWTAYALGHAGLYLTLDDLGRFLQAITSGELVSKATLRRLWQQRTLAGGRRGGFAAGWEYEESGAYRFVGHDGGTRVRVRILFKDSLDGDVHVVAYLTNGSAKSVWSRVLVDSVMAAVAPDRFPAEALAQTLVSYALQAPAEGDASGKARAIRSSATLGDAELERVINITGYAIRESLGVDPALRVFQLNTELFPDSANVWDSLAEAHQAKGDAEKAKALYDKAQRLSAQQQRPTGAAGTGALN